MTRLVRTAASFYGAMAGVAIVWSAIAGRPLFWIGDAPGVFSVVLWAVGGGVLGLGVVFSAELAAEMPWAKALGDWFSTVLGPISDRDALLLALMSGFAEEMLFRGAIQQSFGFLPATVLFGLVHWAPKKELRMWTVTTMIIGAIFGLVTELSGHLTAAIVGHFTVNYINLRSLDD